MSDLAFFFGLAVFDFLLVFGVVTSVFSLLISVVSTVATTVVFGFSVNDGASLVVGSPLFFGAFHGRRHNDWISHHTITADVIVVHLASQITQFTTVVATCTKSEVTTI